MLVEVGVERFLVVLVVGDRREFVYYEFGDLGLFGFVVLARGAGVADEWRCHDRDLIAERGVGEDLLVFCHVGCEHDFVDGFVFGVCCVVFEDCSVGQCDVSFLLVASARHRLNTTSPFAIVVV